MNKINVLLLTFFFVLLSVIAFEVYYFYGRPKKAAPAQNSKVNVTEVAKDITGTVGEFYKEGAAGTLSNLSITMTYVGTLTKLDPTERSITSYRTKVPLSVALTLDLTTHDGHKKEFYLMKSEMSKVSYYLMDKDGKTTPATGKDIKPGDQISYSNTLNLLKPPSDNLMEAKITKLP